MNALLAPVRRADAGARSNPAASSDLGTSARAALLHEVEPVGVEYQVRAARITDVERMVALVADAAPAVPSATLDAADLLRQLVYLPQASVLVAETLRTMAGIAVLALHPSIRAGGYVGTIDVLVVDGRHDEDRVTGLLLEELLRSARNKGCTVVEATPSAGEAKPAAWERLGFRASGPRVECRIGAGRAPAAKG